MGAGECQVGTGPGRRGSTRTSPPTDVGRGLLIPSGGKWSPFEDPLEGVRSRLRDGRVESGAQELGWESRGREMRGMIVEVGAAGRGAARLELGPVGAARLAARGDARRAGAGAAGNRGEGAPRLQGETGWSEVPRAAWAGSAEGSAGSPGAAAGRRAEAGFPRGPGSSSGS